MASLADATARLNVYLRDLVSILQNAKADPAHCEALTKYIDAKQHLDLLELAETFASNMVLVNTSEFIAKLCQCWNGLLDICNMEKKALTKKIKALKEDKKTDPDVLARNEGLLYDIEQRTCTVLIQAARLRKMQ